jgi:ribose transport system ATP-binding protein
VALRLIRRLAAEQVGVVLISHYLAEIFEVCDDLTVMRDGEVVADGPVNATTLPRVVKAMVGRDVETSRRKSHLGGAARGTPLMQVENLTIRGAFQNQLRARRSEVVGVTGLAGSGLNELSRAIFGAAGRRATGGS